MPDRERKGVPEHRSIVLIIIIKRISSAHLPHKVAAQGALQ